MNFKLDLINDLGIDITEKQLDLLNQYYKELISYNEHTNLTRIVDYDEVMYKHFYDSLTLCKSIDMKNITSICDMGSGAGFPSIPLKIIFEHLEVTIVDSLNKRIKFLQQLVSELDLKNVSLIHDRVEIYATKHQKAFDLVTARALGNMKLISEMGIPMTKINGYFIAMKSSNYEEELEEAKETITLLGGKISHITQLSLPHDYGKRSNICVQKTKHISGYPRSYAVMTKNQK